mgnify:CR=1 FL=1
MIAKIDNLKSAIDKMNSGVYDFTDDGKCHNAVLAAQIIFR